MMPPRSAAVSQMELCTIPSCVKTHFPLHNCLLSKFQTSKCWVLHSDRCGTPCKYSAWNLPAIIKTSPLHHSFSWILGFDAMVGITRSKVIFGLLCRSSPRPIERSESSAFDCRSSRNDLHHVYTMSTPFWTVQLHATPREETLETRTFCRSRDLRTRSKLLPLAMLLYRRLCNLRCLHRTQWCHRWQWQGCCHWTLLFRHPKTKCP